MLAISLDPLQTQSEISGSSQTANTFPMLSSAICTGVLTPACGYMSARIFFTSLLFMLFLLFFILASFYYYYTGLSVRTKSIYSD